MTEKLSPNFLNELFRSAFRNKNIFEVLQHYLEYHYLPTKEYKEIWKIAKTHYEAFNELPTIGVIAEHHKTNTNILQQINLIKDADVISQDVLLFQIESYLKDVKFIDLYDALWELREQGKKEEALNELKKRTDEIANFSLRAQSFVKIFGGFADRYNQRLINNAFKGHESIQKAIWGIDCLDNRHYGGVDYGDTALIVALSNVGKSPMLKHIGYANARMGKRVLHIQAEGTQQECEQGYEAMMAASSLPEIERTELSKEVVQKLIDNTTKVTGEIDMVANSKFGSLSMTDVRNYVIEYLKVYGELGVLIVDYIDKVEPGNGKKYSSNTEGEKARRTALADLFKNLCVEFNIAGFTATQASDVPDEKKNDVKFYLTRSNIRGDKNVLDPYSYGITLNQALDEKKNEIMRISEEKCRKYGFGYKHIICTAYRYSRFYDRKRTLNMFGSTT